MSIGGKITLILWVGAIACFLALVWADSLSGGWILMLVLGGGALGAFAVFATFFWIFWPKDGEGIPVQIVNDYRENRAPKGPRS